MVFLSISNSTNFSTATAPNIDAWVNNNIPSIWSPTLTEVMKALSGIFTPTNMLILSAILFLIVLLRKKWYIAAVIFFTVGAASVTDILVEYLTKRPRPPVGLVAATGYSFPSGHAILAVVFFSLLIYSFKDSMKSKPAKGIFITLCILLMLAIMFSRVYLRVHWLTDVIAGAAIGFFWLFLFIFIAEKIEMHREKLSH